VSPRIRIFLLTLLTALVIAPAHASAATSACGNDLGPYAPANQDQTVHPDLQRFVSKRMKAATTEVASSHVPMLSKPAVVLDAIRAAASAVQKG